MEISRLELLYQIVGALLDELGYKTDVNIKTDENGKVKVELVKKEASDDK